MGLVTWPGFAAGLWIHFIDNQAAEGSLRGSRRAHTTWRSGTPAKTTRSAWQAGATPEMYVFTELGGPNTDSARRVDRSERPSEQSCHCEEKEINITE